MPPSNLLTVKESAEIVGISKTTFHHHIGRGHVVPAQQQPWKRGAMFFTRAEVRRFEAKLKRVKTKGESW